MVALGWGPVRFWRHFKGSVNKTSRRAGGTYETRSGSALRPSLCASRWMGSLAGLQQVWGHHGRARPDLGIHGGRLALGVWGSGQSVRLDTPCRLASLEAVCTVTLSVCGGRSRRCEPALGSPERGVAGRRGACKADKIERCRKSGVGCPGSRRGERVGTGAWHRAPCCC